MPYLGNTAGNRFVASKAATQFSGDGSTTAFTLDHAVGSDEDILVSVDGVIQEPSVAYAVSSGTTLTFTAAPSSNSGNNIFVYYLFRTVATVDHPSTSSLQATDGTFSSTLTVTGTTTFTGSVSGLDVNGTEIILDADADTSITSDTDDQIDFKCGGVDRVIIGADGSFTSQPASNGTIVFNEASNDVDFRVESNDNTHGIFLDAGAGLVGIGNSNPDGHYNLADDLVIGNGSGGRGLTIYSGNDSSGYVGFNDAEQDSMTAYIQYGHNDNTMTLASSAGASLKIDSSGNVTKPLNPSFRAMGTNGAYQTTSPIPFNSVSGSGGHNIGSHYNTSNYRFTAPVAGRYLFHVHIGIINIGAAAGQGYPYLRINGTPIAYSYYQFPASATYVGAFLTQIFSLSASDYVDVTFTGANATYYGNYTELSFSGCLIG